MLGLSIDDPHGVESEGRRRCMPGLGKLKVRTVMRVEKTVRRASNRTPMWDAPPFSGYEIHMGETTGQDYSEGRVWGTYIHGLFDDDEFRHSFLKFVRRWWGLAAAQSYALVAAQREGRIDRWAGHLRQSLDMKTIREWTGL